MKTGNLPAVKRGFILFVETANRLGWVDSWTRSDAKVSSDVGVSVNSMKQPVID